MKVLYWLVPLFSNHLVNGLLNNSAKNNIGVHGSFALFQGDSEKETSLQIAKDMLTPVEDTVGRHAENVLKDTLDDDGKLTISHKRMKSVLLGTILAVLLACTFYALHYIKQRQRFQDFKSKFKEFFFEEDQKFEFLFKNLLELEEKRRDAYQEKRREAEFKELLKLKLKLEKLKDFHDFYEKKKGKLQQQFEKLKKDDFQKEFKFEQEFNNDREELLTKKLLLLNMENL